MKNNSKPIVLISRCLGFKACRYDGTIIEFEQIEELKEKFNLKPICPEVGAGLGIPRPPIKLIALNNKKEIGYIFNSRWQLKTKKLKPIIRKCLRKYDQAAGMILKEKSPSCGIKECKYYRPPSIEVKGRTGGILIEEYKKLGLDWPLIDEISLQKPILKHKFIADVKYYHNNR